MRDWQAGLLLLAAVPLIWGLMYAGWRGRRRRQRDLAAPAGAPPAGADVSSLLADVPGTYVSTVVAGRWLDRVVAHGLGTRSTATLAAGRAGAWLRREGAPDLFVPAPDLLRARRERGQAGKYTLEEGLVVITWRLGDTLLDTAFRPRSWPDIAGVEAALATLAPVPEGLPPATAEGSAQ